MLNLTDMKLKSYKVSMKFMVNKQTPLKIAFNLLSAKAGAGISVYKTLLPSISHIDKNNKYLVFISYKQTDLKDLIPQNIKMKVLKFVPNNPFLRVIWEQIIFPFYLIRNKIDILYSVGNITTILAPCKILLFIENQNPFTRIVKSWSFKEKVRNKLLFLLGWLSAKRADKIRFCSERSMEIISEIYSINHHECFVLHHGIDFKWINNIKIVKLYFFNFILSVSVIAPHKNFEVLLKAFSLLKKENIYKGKLIIVGDIYYYPFYYKMLVELCKSEQIFNDVLFTGKITYNEIFKFYKNADLFVLPSIEETFGIPLIEAMYCNIPVIVSDGKKYKDLFIPFNEIAKDEAFYFDPFSEKDLFEKMKSILMNKNEFQKSNSKAFVEKNYSIDAIAEKLVEEFNKLRD